MTGAAPPDAVARIDALLPQTQCTRCGYPGCLPYAAAIAAGGAEINQCPPGGSATIRELSLLLDKPYLPLNPENGEEGAALVAFVDETRCIGCARCLPACPVDAIIGAPKFMHTVIAERCTGCALCLAPCPVDCIEMRPPEVPTHNRAALNRARFQAHTERATRRAVERQVELAAKKACAVQSGPAGS